ncbi:hypothetical protein KKF84_13005 [Myxococcota bacterium]|nr:hypothetical protein [Myxococcota bacterium]
MSILVLLQFGLTVAIVLFLRPHLALVLQSIHPGIVRQRFSFRPLPGSEAFQELADSGYRYLGCRTESIWLLMNNTYYVFYHPSGYYLDLLEGASGKMYMLSTTPGGLFFLTRNYGFRSFNHGPYSSHRVEGEFSEVTVAHRKNLERHALGEVPDLAGSAVERLALGERWYRSFLRREILPFTLLSVVLLLLSAAMIYRLWSV